MARISLDTVFDGDGNMAEEVLKFVSKLNARGISIQWDGEEVNGWPDVNYSGDRKDLEWMVDEFFGDPDLKDYIEEESDAS